MTREIKFRGITVNTNEVVYSMTISKGTIKRKRNDYFFEVGENKWVGVIPESIGQFTGKKDIEGIDIYEGDILNGDAGILVVKFGEFDNKKEYANNGVGVGFYLERNGKCEYSLTTKLLLIYKLKVVGNIYQSELVK